jgi:hypothetical protein
VVQTVRCVVVGWSWVEIIEQCTVGGAFSGGPELQNSASQVYHTIPHYPIYNCLNTFKQVQDYSIGKLVSYIYQKY